MTTFEYLVGQPATGLLRLGDLARVVDALRQGQLAVLPTETGYLLAALATDEDALDKAFKVKGRDVANTMHIACSSLAMARTFADLTPVAVRLLGELTPGPLSVVVRQTDRLPTGGVTVNGTVGIRIPDHPATSQVIAALGAPVTATSLNRSGEPASTVDRRELERLNWPSDETVYVVVDDNPVRFDRPSTLVRVTGPEIEFLRAGPVSESDVIGVCGALPT